MTYRKTYIDVSAAFDKTGNITPYRLVWGDGRIFEIDSVSQVIKCPSKKVHGFGKRFTVRILGQERYLFLEPFESRCQSIGRWFVEEPVKNSAESEAV